MKEPLPPIEQSFYDENRQRFHSDYGAIDITTLNRSCDHVLERVSYHEVKCKKCNVGWYDHHRFVITNGKLTAIE